MLLLLLSFSSPSVTMAQQIAATTTPPLTPEEQEQQNRLQNVIAATNQNLDEAEKEVNGIVYTPRWSDVVWVEPDSLSILFAYCLPGEFAESGQEILGGFELEVLESYEIALPQGFMAWMMVIGNEDRQDRLPAAVGVVCASDLNDVETRVLSPQEQQEINNVVQQFITTQVTNIEQVINIINNVTTNATTPVTPPLPTNDTGDGGGTTPPPGGGGGGGGLPGGGAGGIPENATAEAADTTAPVLTVPQNIVVEASTLSGFANVEFSVTATDDLEGVTVLEEDGSLNGFFNITCNPPSGSQFPVGVITVECTATDRSGNQSPPASFTVRVNRPPIESPFLAQEQEQPPPPAAATEEEQEQEAPVQEEQPPAEDEGAASPPANEAGGGG